MHTDAVRGMKTMERAERENVIEREIERGERERGEREREDALKVLRLFLSQLFLSVLAYLHLVSSLFLSSSPRILILHSLATLSYSSFPRTSGSTFYASPRYRANSYFSVSPNCSVASFSSRDR